MLIYNLHQSINIPREGDTQIIFWRGVRPEVWNPYPNLKIFSSQKMADFKVFRHLRKSGPISTSFYTLKMADLWCNQAKWVKTRKYCF